MPEARHAYLRSAGAVSAAVLLSRTTGLVREMVMARLFGAGQAYDAFLLGFRIPNLARDLFAEGALSSAFVPVFTDHLANRGPREAARLFNLLATALIVVVGVTCLLGMAFSPALVRLLAPGFERVPGKFELAVSLTRVMFPFLLLVALAAQAMGVLNACNRFAVPALASAVFNVASLGFGLAAGFTLGRWMGQPLIVSMAYGVVFGGLAQLAWQAPSLWKEGFPYRPAVDFSHPGLWRILRLMGPAVVGNAAVQINVLVNTNFASGITDAAGRVIDGPVSWLGYAFRFLQLPLGLFGAAIAAAVLPSISRSAAMSRMGEFRATASHALATVLLLTIPSSVGLVILGESMIGAVYQWGRFQAYDTHQTALALTGYALGLAGYSAVKILAPAFYALGDARTPMLVSVVSIVVNFACAAALVRTAGLGHVGLALSTSVVATLAAALLLAVLRFRLGGINGRKLLSSTARICFASAVMGAVCLISTRSIHHVLGQGKVSQLADVTFSIPLGALVFCSVAQWLRVPEFDSLRGAAVAFVRDRRRTQRARIR